MKRILTRFILITGLMIKVVWGQELRLGDPVASGTGCPDGTVTAILSPGQTSISVLFDSFEIQNPKGSNRVITKACRFIIPFTVTPGWKVHAASVTYRGYVFLPRRASVVLSTTNLFSNPRFGQPISTQTTLGDYRAPIDQNFLITQTSSQARSDRCDESRAIDFTTQMAMGPTRTRFSVPMETDGLSTIDSWDLAQGDGPITIGVQLARCR